MVQSFSSILVWITVSFAGKGFKTYIEAGDVGEAGQKLIEFDLATIRDAKLPVITRSL